MSAHHTKRFKNCFLSIKRTKDGAAKLLKTRVFPLLKLVGRAVCGGSPSSYMSSSKRTTARIIVGYTLVLPKVTLHWFPITSATPLGGLIIAQCKSSYRLLWMIKTRSDWAWFDSNSVNFLSRVFFDCSIYEPCDRFESLSWFQSS